MDFNFTPQEVIFIYGHFRKETIKLKNIKDNPNCPIADETIDQDINLYTSIADKIAKVNPKLNEMDKFL